MNLKEVADKLFEDRKGTPLRGHRAIAKKRAYSLVVAHKPLCKTYHSDKNARQQYKTTFTADCNFNAAANQKTYHCIKSCTQIQR